MPLLHGGQSRLGDTRTKPAPHTPPAVMQPTAHTHNCLVNAMHPATARTSSIHGRSVARVAFAFFASFGYPSGSMILCTRNLSVSRGDSILRGGSRLRHDQVVLFVNDALDLRSTLMM